MLAFDRNIQMGTQGERKREREKEGSRGIEQR